MKQSEPEKQDPVSNGSVSKIENPLSEKVVKSFSSTGLSKQDSKQLYDITQQELDMIAAVVMHEVGHCSRESKVAVTNVILNRLKDGRFGDSIYDILHQPNQFSAISNYYTPTIPADEACYEAVHAALQGEDNSNGALYYCNPQYIFSDSVRAWFDSLEVVLKLDGQLFYIG